MRKTKKKSEAETQGQMERLLADVAVNERELRNQRTKEGRGKGKKTGRKAGVRRGGR
jgi:DNA invertase Pin-like site-specific DNA recombinase